MEVLNSPVSPALLRQWVDWFAPARQPFYGSVKQLRSWKLEPDDTKPDRQLRDTYLSYHLDSGLRSVWLDEHSFLSLPQATRAALVRAQVTHERGAVPSVRRWHGLLGEEVRSQADGHRFVWWKSLLRGSRAAEVLPCIVSDDLQPSRHRDVTSWPTKVLPRARSLAGTWSTSGEANCFGTVMAAAGQDTAEIWMQREPFVQWLAGNTEPGGRNDDVPGTVFVWRDTADRLVQHAAVTLGGGYMFHKPSQEWASPREVRTVAEVLRSTRTAGWHLERHSLLR